jgi:hypothetical protein
MGFAARSSRGADFGSVLQTSVRWVGIRPESLGQYREQEKRTPGPAPHTVRPDRSAERWICVPKLLQPEFSLARFVRAPGLSKVTTRAAAGFAHYDWETGPCALLRRSV